MRMPLSLCCRITATAVLLIGTTNKPRTDIVLFRVAFLLQDARLHNTEKVLIQSKIVFFALKAKILFV